MENSQSNNKRKRSVTINDLPDELLLKILCSFPITIHTIRVSEVSKRWQSVWKEVKIFKYDIAYFSYSSFIRFIQRRSSVESLHLKVISQYMPIKYVVKVALQLSLRELRFEMVYKSFVLPDCLYNNNISSQLETLVLQKLSLVDVPSDVSLTCIKSLQLFSVKFSSDQSVKTLLRICPRLEDLVVKQSSYTNIKIFTIDVPTLRSLSIYKSSSSHQPKGVVQGFVINTPSLTHFSIRDSFSNYLRFENMLNLVKASVNIVSSSLRESLSSHLEILEWRQYHGKEQEREAAKYILANASHLKKATFYLSEPAEKHLMLKELECVARGSETCQLVFV